MWRERSFIHTHSQADMAHGKRKRSSPDPNIVSLYKYLPNKSSSAFMASNSTLNKSKCSLTVAQTLVGECASKGVKIIRFVGSEKNPCKVEIVYITFENFVGNSKIIVPEEDSLDVDKILGRVIVVLEGAL